MQGLLLRYTAFYGYMPTVSEVYALYSQGALQLTDSEENALIKTYKEG